MAVRWIPLFSLCWVLMALVWWATPAQGDSPKPKSLKGIGRHIKKDSTQVAKDSLTTNPASPHPPTQAREISLSGGNDLIERDSSQVVKHEFNHREQVIVGGVIMASLATILVIMNNYNPK